jgi:hypothetical protein
MLRHLVPLTFAVAFVAHVARVRAGDTPAQARPRLGINLAGIADTTSELPFVDVFRSSRPWVSQQEGKPWGQGPPLVLDERGWVKKLQPGCWAVAIMLTLGGHYPEGRYTVLYDGRGKLEAMNSARLVGQSPGRLTIEISPKFRGNSAFLKLARTDPSNYVRNIRVLMPGVSEQAVRKNPWNPAFLRLWRGMACVRFMDMMETNNSKVRTWADRPGRDDATFVGRGVPVELLCDLANRLGTDAWFCMPHMADDDYVRRFAAAVKARLDRRHKIYVEYSNEVWNTMFRQHRYAAEQGRKLGLADKDWEAAWHYTAVRSVEIFRIWEKVLGSRKRLVRVLPSQAANAYISEQIAGFRNAGKHADVLAIAPYLTLNVGPETKPKAAEVATWTVEKVLGHLESHSLPEAARWIVENKRVADRHGLKLVAYEGGQHMVGILGAENNEQLTKLLLAANAAPRLGSIYDRYFAAWQRAGGDLFCYFSSVSSWSKWGSWGLLQFLDDDRKASPKWKATMRWARKLGQFADADRGTVPAPTVDEPVPRPGMGWSTFNFFGARHNDKLLRRMGAAFVASGLRDAGYTILRIDGGWWGDDGNRRWYYWTRAGKYAHGGVYRPGDPHVDPKNYPGGIRPLADYLHKKGLKLGFYLAPELSTGASDNYPANEDRKERPPIKGLELVEQHARWVVDNGIDHLFYDGYDWNEGRGIGPYTRMYSALRKEAKRVKRPIIFSINSGWHARPREWADEWRTGPDINGEWRTILECLATGADPKPAGKGRWNNPDYLMIGFCGDEEAKSQMSLWCVAGSPLYTSYDFRVMNAWECYVLLNTEAIAVDQDAGGRPGKRLRVDGAAQVWARPLADGSKAVALLNAGDKPLTVTVRWAELGLPPGPAQVRDLWAHKNIGGVEKGYAAKNLPPRGCALLKVVAGHKPLPEPKATWASHPGKRPALKPLPTDGWRFRTDLSRKDDRLSNLADGDPKTGFWSWAEPGKRVELDLGKAVTFDRLVIDHKGVGPNPWPYKVHAPRSTFTLEVSRDGKMFRKVAADSFGPAYTLITFRPLTARHVRLVLGEVERTNAYGDTVWGAKDIYLFNTRAQGR